MKPDLEKLIKNSVQIASLPLIFEKINSAIEDPQCSFSEIAKIISGDTSLSVRLLKLANSSFFGLPFKIETITHAITIIGMAQLRDLVLATTIVNQFKGVKGINMKSFWHHSVAVGLAARIIAIYRRESNAERYYVLGMLHDLGYLVMYLNSPDEANKNRELYETQKKLLYQVEREVMGFDHADVGGALLKVWRLPERMEEAVCNHHRPLSAARHSIEASIIHVADVIAHALELGSSGEKFVPPLDPKAWDLLQLPTSLLSSIVSQMNRQFSDAIAMFPTEK